MAVLVTDPDLEKELRTERESNGDDRWNECWEGVLVMAAVPNNEHQLLVSKLNSIIAGCIDWDRGDMSLPGANVSDRVKDWKENYRVPDLVVYLAGGSARNCDTHWCGGLDLLIEIASPGEDPREKLKFYSAVGTRELVVLERKPWALELYKLRKGKLVSSGRSEPTNSTKLASGVLPLSFQIQPGKPRPKILVTHVSTAQTWTV